MKKTVSALMAVMMLFWLTCAAYAGDMTWKYDEENAVVSVGGYGMINDGSFLTQYLNSVKKIDIQKGVTAIEKNVFSNCGTVEQVSLPDGFLTIGENSFGFCKYLKTINLPDSLKTIGNEAFMGCMSLDGVVIPKNVSYIGTNSFADCAAIEAFEVSGENEYFTTADGVIFNKDKTELVMYPPGRKDESYTVPEGTVKIREKAFSYNINLKKVKMADSVENIDGYAFYFCENLKEVDFNESIKTIGSYAFYGSALKNVFIPYGCEQIGEGAFKNCLNLLSADIPATVENIGEGAFYATADRFKIKGFGSLAVDYSFKENKAFEQTARIIVDGRELRCDTAAYVENGCTMVPMRSIFEALGADVSWDAASQSANAKKDGITCSFAIGDNILYKNGEQTVLLAPAVIKNDTTFVHVRAVAEAFGADVSWNQAFGLVNITVH